jgi:hypothetical protein
MAGGRDWVRAVAKPRNIYWPSARGLYTGFTSLAPSRKICHLCGRKRPRWMVCTGCDLIVCKDCSAGNGLCVTCWRVKRSMWFPEDLEAAAYRHGSQVPLGTGVAARLSLARIDMLGVKSARIDARVRLVKSNRRKRMSEMRELRRRLHPVTLTGPGSVDHLKPGTWVGFEDGCVWARCQRCGRKNSFDDKNVDQEGRIEPSIQCSSPLCLNAFTTLEGWEDDRPYRGSRSSRLY